MPVTIQKYYKEIPGGIVIRHMQGSDAMQLEELQKIVFPTLAEDELIRADHYLRHLEVFPEGQFVITDAGRVIGMTTTMRTDFDFLNYHHTFKETIGGGWLTNHNPEGEWLYGLDMGLLPDYRGKGLARILYRARHEIARSLGLNGQLTVGMMSGYGAVSKEMTGEIYYEQLIQGKRIDPTLTPQMKIGFEPIVLMPNHLNDPVCGNYGILIKLDIDKTV
jgi:GNAT superfamily N-acetyltransferase